MKLTSSLVVTILLFCTLRVACGQTTPGSVTAILRRRVQPTSETVFQLQRFLMERIPSLEVPSTAQDWTAEEARLRKHILNDIAFHGWPRQWIDSPPKFVPAGIVETDSDYRLRKLRYEILPGFWSTALLYEPAHMSGRIPAILNVNGHWPLGKAEEFTQKRCINFAKQGIIALNLEWFGMGELSQPEDAHNYGADLDLVGANALGLFYLAMRRGLDYLATLPAVDPNRLGITGVSGGGWQTSVLAALDPRVKVMVEVAGIGSLQTNITHPLAADDIEQDATDLCDGEDYSYLVAMRAPRPTLLIHNANDNCCFRSMIVKPYIYTHIKPFFQLFGKPDHLAWHENLNPGNHNYQIDNRQHAYAFFTRYFNMPITEKEIPSDADIKTYQQLVAGVPKDNLTVLGLARESAGKITRPPIPTEQAAETEWAHSERLKLQSVIREKPVRVTNAWRMWNKKGMGVESLFYRLDFNNGLSATAVWIKAVAVPRTAPATIVLNDQGRAAAGGAVSDRVNRGDQVLALDLLFTGEMRPPKPDPFAYDLLVSTVGKRPLGLEVAQLVAAAQWLGRISGHPKVCVETSGIRSQVIALTAAAIEPFLFSQVVTHGGMRSLQYLLDAPVPYHDAPDLFCLDFYKDFDLNRLITIARPTPISEDDLLNAASK
ncbi:MAG: alpha/beta hydrolase family protein [Terriglobia bacterium]